MSEFELQNKFRVMLHFKSWESAAPPGP